jgi:hypothetical protein
MPGIQVDTPVLPPFTCSNGLEGGGLVTYHRVRALVPHHVTPGKSTVLSASTWPRVTRQ